MVGNELIGFLETDSFIIRFFLVCNIISSVYAEITFFQYISFGSDGTGTSGQGRVLAIGATNRPNELDDAARRRFVKRLYIPLPEASDRVVLLKTLLSKNNHGLSEKEITKISRETKGFSGADLKALCTDAALGPIRELGVKALEVNASDVPAISYRHFRRAIKGMNPSVAESDLVLYNEWNETYGSKSISAEDYEGLSDEDDENDDK